MATLASFTLTSGTYNSPYGPVFYGFIAGQHPNMPQTGSINGSTEYATPTSWYSTTSLWNLYFIDYYTDQVQLRLRGATASPANSGWASMSIASYGPYNRIDGSYTALNNPTYPRNATWTWTTNTNPLFSGDYTVTIDDGVTSVTPDTSITVEKNSPLFNTSSFNVRLTNTTSTTSYEIRSSSYSGTVLKTITNQDNVWVTVNNQPSTAGTTYYITAYVSSANGGDESRSDVTTFTVTRSSEVNPDTAITQSPSGAITTSNATFTKSITNANSNSVTDYRLLRTTGTDTQYDIYTGTATSFNLTGDMPSSGSWTYVIQARIPTANNGDNVWVNVGSSFTVTRSSSGSSSGGTTYNEYGSTTDITRNIFNDDLINVYYNVQGADTNNSWFISDLGCVATPGAGFFYSGHPTGSTFMSYLNSFSGSSYSAEFFVGGTSKFTISGTVTDPYGVTNINFSSKTVTPGNGTTTTESVAQTFDTFREGETLDYSVTGGELYNGVAWGTSGTVADGASLKLRGVTPAVYSGSQTVTVTFSKNSVTKRTESFVIYTPALIPLGITTGAIDLNTLRNFFGNPTYNSNTISMSDLYRGGNLVPDITENATVPTSGEIELADLYGSYTYLSIDKNPDVKQFFIPYGQPEGTAVLNWSMSTSPTGQGSVDTGYKALKFVCDYRWIFDVTDTSGNVPNLSVLEWGGVNYASQATSFPYTTPWHTGLSSLNVEYDYGIQTGSVAGTVRLEVRKIWNGVTYSAQSTAPFWEVVVENANE